MTVTELADFWSAGRDGRPAVLYALDAMERVLTVFAVGAGMGRHGRETHQARQFRGSIAWRSRREDIRRHRFKVVRRAMAVFV
jgi:hypothetical protein